MDLRVLFAPVFATCVLGLLIAAVTWARPQARGFGVTRGWALGALLVFAAALLLSQAGLEPGAWVAWESVLKALGTVALVAAAVMAWRGSRERQRAEVLASQAPRSLDEAIEAVRATGVTQRGVFSGRIGADEEVTSPGGVVCAFYEAQIRQRRLDGQKGSLLSTERAASQTMWLRGERVQAMVNFAVDGAFAPEEARKCTVAGSLAYSEGRALVDGDVPVDATSYERVGRIGEPCLVVGELRRGPAPGSYLIRGVTGGAALLVVAQETTALGKALLRRSWLSFAGAAALALTAAWMLGR